jgi:hypothetical protein
MEGRGQKIALREVEANEAGYRDSSLNARRSLAARRDRRPAHLRCFCCANLTR